MTQVWKTSLDASSKTIAIHTGNMGLTDLQDLTTKGQLISKCPFGVIVWTKIPTIFLRNSALASKKRSNQKKSLTK